MLLHLPSPAYRQAGAGERGEEQLGKVK